MLKKEKLDGVLVSCLFVCQCCAVRIKFSHTVLVDSSVKLSGFNKDDIISLHIFL